MDENLENRWLNGLAPFSGNVIRPVDWIPLSELRQCLKAIVGQLKTDFGNARLLTLHDWHDHDGCRLAAKKSSWEELEKCLETDDSLYLARTGDFAVRIGVYPETAEWYFRFYVEDEDGDEQYPGKWGDFDLTANEQTLAKIQLPLTKVVIEKLDAKRFFDACYAG
ncbi:MAG: hypothetical protein HC841_01490 [Verrucomicrobiae bacterium]|nr:hypothetical protein [Verrucomicrobiae bacterium]